MNSSQQPLQNRVVVITGGARGLGLGMAQRFAAAGDQVIIADVNEETGQEAAKALAAAGVAVAFASLDVCDPAQSNALVTTLVQTHGRLDVWVNNAGVSLLAPAATMPRTFWDESIATMLSGAFYCAQAAGRQMLTQGYGVIVNIGSVTGMLHEKERVAYSTAKAGLMALTEALGVEWASSGVRVVGVAPAVVETEMVKATIAQGAGTLATYRRRTPLRRLGTVEEIAEAVYFLASDEAAYITAETLRVDGGWTAYQLF